MSGRGRKERKKDKLLGGKEVESWGDGGGRQRKPEGWVRSKLFAQSDLE